MKKIAILTLTLTRGGAERVIANLCNDRLADEYEVTLITCMNKPVGYTLDKRVRFLCLEDTEDVKYRNLADRFIKRRKALRAVLDECKPDLLLCFLPEPNMLALSLKSRYKFPIIISVRNDPKREYSNKIYYMLMRLFYPKADGYVFQTEEAKEYFAFSKHILDSSRIIPNPLSKEYMDMDDVHVDRKKTIVNVGKLDAQKNQRLLISAFEKIATDYPDWTLHIYGEGELRDELTQFIDGSGLTGRVVLEGNQADLKYKIKDAGIFVLSSDYEGMPNALIEAMALGIPSISTDCPCGGPRFLIEDGVNGRLVPVKDDKALSVAMVEYISDKAKADDVGEKAKNIKKVLDPDQINSRWADYIEEYISGN